MLKLKFVKKHLIFSIFLILAVVLSGCKSIPESYTVEPLNLLDMENDFYVSVPYQADPEFINYLLINNIQSNLITSESLNQLENRIDHIYCGIKRNKSFFEIQAAIKDSIPVKYVSKQLDKNQVITKTEFRTSSNINYKIFTYNEMNIAFPSNNLTLAGRDLDKMLELYDLIEKNGLSTEESLYDNQEMYNYLYQAENEIRFYGKNPQAFLSILVGSSMDLKLQSIFGSFSVDTEFSNQYVVDLHLIFKNEKYMKAGKTLLSLAFGLSNGQTFILENNELQISGIKIAKEQLYKLLVL